jgi:CheY-like chemotaxis protein
MPSAQKSTLPFSSLLVLVVDDCPFQRELTGMMLERWGITPIVASDGQEAIHLDGCQDFDIILMDIQMPEMDGFEATRLIREAQSRRKRSRPVPVIAYTACRLPLDAELVRQSGISDALRKPCDATTMRDCLSKWCADKIAPSIRRVRNVAHA